MKHLLLVPALTGLLCVPAIAGDLSSPSGFNVETIPAAGPLALVLADGTRLISTGSFGAAELSVLHPGGATTPWASGFSSLAGIAQSPLTGEVVVGDSSGAVALWILVDANDDGDALDAGEMTPHPATIPLFTNGAAPLPYALVFAPGTDDLYMSGSTPFGGPPTMGGVTRTSGGTMTVYAENMGFAADMVFADDTLYVADVDATFFTGRVWSLTDANADDDAADPGEALVYADFLSGANGLARAADGTLWISGGFDFDDFSSCVGRIFPDADRNGFADGVEECVFDGFSFTGSLFLTEGAGGFNPGAGGDGELLMGDFGFDGNYLFRTAPLASTTVTGTVAQNSEIHVLVGGASGADALFIISLDTVGVTIPGIGDLGLGFGDLHVISPMLPIGGSGEADFEVIFRDLPTLVGLPLVIQGVTLEAGEIGLGHALGFVFGA